jgi:hypothetical protein
VVEKERYLYAGSKIHHTGIIMTKEIEIVGVDCTTSVLIGKHKNSDSCGGVWPYRRLTKLLVDAGFAKRLLAVSGGAYKWRINSRGHRVARGMLSARLRSFGVRPRSDDDQRGWRTIVKGACIEQAPPT